MTVVLYSDLRDMVGEMQPHFAAAVVFDKILRLLLHVATQISKTHRYFLFRELPLSLISRLSRGLERSSDGFHFDPLRSRSITNCQFMMNELMSKKLNYENFQLNAGDASSVILRVVEEQMIMDYPTYQYNPELVYPVGDVEEEARRG